MNLDLMSNQPVDGFEAYSGLHLKWYIFGYEDNWAVVLQACISVQTM